eukprot:7093439-Pyramimonas_sp.AAC.1
MQPAFERARCCETFPVATRSRLRAVLGPHGSNSEDILNRVEPPLEGKKGVERTSPLNQPRPEGWRDYSCHSPRKKDCPFHPDSYGRAGGGAVLALGLPARFFQDPRGKPEG